MSASPEIRSAQLRRALEDIAVRYAPAAVASSLSAEDMVLTDTILRHDLGIEIFTLDTGRLHADSAAVIDAVRERYGYSIKVCRPDPASVNEYAARFGADAFYESVEMRQRCCGIRKVEPLRRALAGKAAWITGQRREQSPTRTRLGLEEYDSTHRMAKFNPLADWSESDVWAYIRANAVPYNALYDQGYRSIGCAPCSRPTTPLEDLRAGRWWWEHPESRECGLHVAADGRLVRKAAEAEAA